MSDMRGIMTRIDHDIDHKGRHRVEITIRSTGETDLEKLFGFYAEGCEVELTISRKDGVSQRV